MEMDEIQTSNKCNRNGKIDSNRSSFGDEEAEDGEIRRRKPNGARATAGGGGLLGGGGGGGGATLDFTSGGLCGWPSSRIVRVSRASGGKDRHSKVLTSKGLRDRRVRLSVNTAIQFYDLQDRLGYDQPSKAVDWLLKAAENSISELPPISTPFPDTPKQQLSDTEKRDVEMEGGGKLSKSGCSSNSETSKGSGGILSRSESRLKARERARERAAKDKETTENIFGVQHQTQKHYQNISSMSQNGTFTELLSSGSGGGGLHESNFFQKSTQNWSATAMDCFGGTTGLLVPSTTSRSTHGFSSQIQLGNSLQQALSTTHVSSPFFTVSGDNHQELHSFPEQYVPVVTTTNGNNNHNSEYNLDFSISSTSSSSLAGFNRGTLQSNSSTLPQIQRFPSTDNNGSSPSAFFLGAAPPASHHHFHPTAFDAGLQLFYGDSSSHADQKGKRKS